MKLYAFTDESGNSGLQLFDTNQPVFWSGTLISFADADEKYKAFHKKMLDAAGVAELHGNQLGFTGIEKIANTLEFFIRQKKLHFTFVRVDKQSLAATKLFDLVFDSGSNPAMPPHAYGIRQLRLVNVMHFVQMLTMDDLKEFWALFEKQDASAFGLLLRAHESAGYVETATALSLSSQASRIARVINGMLAPLPADRAPH